MGYKVRTRHVGGPIRVVLKPELDERQPVLDAVIVSIREYHGGRFVNRVRITSPHHVWHGQEIEGRKWNVAKEPATTPTGETINTPPKAPTS